MGYTHYWTPPQETIQREIWASFKAKVQLVLNHSPVKLANGMGEVDTSPILDDDELLLNGSGEDSFETLHLSRASKEWNFTKTGRRPYDVVVVAVLLLAYHELGYEVTSDGEPEDWQDGVELLQRALGNSNTLEFNTTKLLESD